MKMMDDPKLWIKHWLFCIIQESAMRTICRSWPQERKDTLEGMYIELKDLEKQLF